MNILPPITPPDPERQAELDELARPAGFSLMHALLSGVSLGVAASYAEAGQVETATLLGVLGSMTLYFSIQEWQDYQAQLEEHS